jgi:hypothetical protein
MPIRIRYGDGRRPLCMEELLVLRNSSETSDGVAVADESKIFRAC